MKKLLTMLLVVMMALSVAACGGNSESGGQADAGEITDALEILTTVWGSYEEAEVFPVAGGDSANANWEGPAKFDLKAADELEANFGVPADLVEQVDDAATMMHAMMANNFAVGAYHLTDGANADDFATALKDALLAKQWLCGQPEKVMIFTVGDYVVSVYGLGDLLDAFETKLTTAYPAAKLAWEENIA